MRALMVLPYPPVLEGGAAIRCALGLLRGLRERGVECRILAAGYDPDASYEPSALPTEIVVVERLPADLPARLRARWIELSDPQSLLARGEFLRRLRALAGDADVVHAVGIEAALAMPLGARPWVAQLDCVTSRDRRVRRPWRQADRMTIQLLRSEHKVRRRADHLLVSSPEVALEMSRRTPAERLTVARLGLDPDHYARRADLERPTAGLIGTAIWPPTAASVRRLLTRVWPLVLACRPEARLLLAGNRMEPASFPDVPHLPGVEWLGRVDSATDFLCALGLLLYPLSSGSGVKVKVLESLAVGLPVVSTPEGAEGLGGRGGVTVEVDDERLAAAALALMDDRELRLREGELAHETFVAHHSPGPIAGPVIDLYGRMLA